MTIIPQRLDNDYYAAQPPTVSADLPRKDGPLGKDANIVATGFKTRIADYRLLSYAQSLLIENNVTNTQGGRHRTRMCHAARAYTAETITLNLSDNPEYSYASLGGVQTCGSVWSCPVCAKRIAVKRGKEIYKALQWADDAGFIPIMITLTAQHDSGMRLDAFKTQFKQAWRYLSQSREYRKLKKQLNVAHSIKAIEITRGAHGWHYHQHGLLFIPKGKLLEYGDDELQGWVLALTDQWLHCLERVGLMGIGEYACDVRFHGQVADLYLSKLGLETSQETDAAHELSGSSNKRGRGANIWTILRRASQGNPDAAQWYVEYVQAMQGDNWITWSHGFKALVGADEIDDQAASDDPDNENVEMVAWMAISDDQYRPVRYFRVVGDLLELAAISRSKTAILAFFEQLQSAYDNKVGNRITHLRQQYSWAAACAREAQKALNKQYSDFGSERLQQHQDKMQSIKTQLSALGEEI